ncbi:MAG: hypothetical protein M3258_07335 [Thermoproteota archaeon]|nr:hypothetical protein [Thermoproteota archaeon]
MGQLKTQRKKAAGQNKGYVSVVLGLFSSKGIVEAHGGGFGQQKVHHIRFHYTN